MTPDVAWVIVGGAAALALAWLSLHRLRREWERERRKLRGIEE